VADGGEPAGALRNAILAQRPTVSIRLAERLPTLTKLRKP